MASEKKKQSPKKKEEFDFCTYNDDLEKDLFPNIFNDASRFINFLKNEEFDKKEFSNAKKMIFTKRRFEVNKLECDFNINTNVFLNEIFKNELDVNFDLKK